jgi:2-aminoadipate transaminase
VAIDWKTKYARRNVRMSRSLIREMLKQSTSPGVISLAGGLPAPELFPLEVCEEASQRVLHNMGGIALQYGETEGYMPLREFICGRVSRYGIKAKPLNVVITQGSQQGLDLVGKVMIDAGDNVIVEAPSYLGALQAFTAYEAEFVSVPMDEDGIRTDILAQQVSKKPKFMYILPNFQNPSGTTLSLKRRQEVVEISNQYGIPILEDDPYGSLRFEGEHISPLVVLDSEYQKANGNGRHGFDAGNVIYLGTFSKTLAPGLRLGWVVAPDNILNQLVIAKQGADLHSTMFTQAVVYEMIKDGFLDVHIPIIRKVYRERRDIMLENLARYFPEGCTWTKPQGGLFLWVTVPEWLDLVALLVEAIEFKVVYVPGIAFYADPNRGKNTMRLNFSNMQPEQIEEGIKRLGSMLKKVMVKA